MADTALDTYIDELIAWDSACALSAMRLCKALDAIDHKHFGCITKFYNAPYYSFDTHEHYHPDDNVSLTPDELFMASFMALSLAGEAAKNLERTRPDLIENYPDFPWVALKRVRDFCSHPARDIDPNVSDYGLGKSKEKFNKEFDRLVARPDQRLPPDDQPVFDALYTGIWQFKGIQHLLANAENELNVSLNMTPVMYEAADIAGTGENARLFPLMIVNLYRMTLMNALNDRFRQLSSVGITKNFSSQELRTIRSMLASRDHLCHHVDTVYRQEGDTSSDITTHMNNARLTAKQLATSIEQGEFAPSLVSETAVTDMHETYKSAILGKIANNPSKLEQMERATRWVMTASPKNYQLQTAYIRSVKNLLERAPIHQCSQVLDYIESANCKLTNITKLKEFTQASPHAIRRMTRSFVDDFISKMNTDLLSSHRISQAGRA